MRIKSLLETNRHVLVVAVLAVILLFPLGYYAVLHAVPQDNQPFLERPDAKYKECVKETTYMRFQHMDLLRETRDQFVRAGTRGEITLNKCKDCHTSRARFCDKCHNAVTLHPDCFGCHYYPEAPPRAAAEAHVITARQPHFD
jgi:hypothetical protein